MARPRAGSHDVETTERVLEAAIEEFAAHGLHGANLEDIARVAGIRRPSLLYHFGSKDELHRAAVHEAFRRLGAALGTAMETDGDFDARFDALVRTFAADLKAQPALARLVLREVLDEGGPGQALLRDEAAPLIEDVERFLRRSPRPLRKGLPVREALLGIVSSVLLASAAGPLGDALWGEKPRTLKLARTLFFQEEGS